jgi:hypothetical protein
MLFPQLNGHICACCRGPTCKRNMACVQAALGQETTLPPVQRHAFAASGPRLLAFLEYDVESVLFWLRGPG